MPPVRGPAAGGGSWYDVTPGRLEDWHADFSARHGPTRCSAAADRVDVVGSDGARAVVTVPFPPLVLDSAPALLGLVAHAARERLVGVLLVRLGGFAAGVFRGSNVVVSKVGARPVHGRSAAGGQSQQRFARRREGQARAALSAAADTAARVLLPHAAGLDGLVLGGDRRAAHTVLADPRLAHLAPSVTGPWLDVPDPRHRMLIDAPRRYRAVRITELPVCR